MKTLAILENDTPVPKVVDSIGRYGVIFETLLRNAGMSRDEWAVESYDVVSKLPDLDSIDAVLLTGSKHNSYDDDEWILRVVKFTQKALSKKLPVVGICFGHQIVARALGCKVGPNTKGWEISSSPIELTEKGKELFGFAAAKGSLNIMQMHRDIVYDLPSGTELIASTQVCPIQAYYKPKEIWCVQGHPEFTDFIVKAICEVRRASGVFDAEFYADAVKRADIHHDGLSLAKSIVEFLNE